MDPGKYLNTHGATPLMQHVHVEKNGPNPNSKQESSERDEQLVVKERELEDLRRRYTSSSSASLTVSIGSVYEVSDVDGHVL